MSVSNSSVTEQTIHLSVNKTLTKSLVSNVKAAGDTGILTQINNNLEDIIEDKLSTEDFGTAIATLQTEISEAITTLQGKDSTATITATITALSAISTAIANLQAGVLTDANFRTVAKAYYDSLTTKIDNIDLSSINNRLDDSTYGLAAIKTKLDNMKVDVPEDVARETTPKAIETKVGDVESILQMLNEGEFTGDPSYATATQAEELADYAKRNAAVLVEGVIYAIVSIDHTGVRYIAFGLTTDGYYKMKSVMAGALDSSYETLYAKQDQSDNIMYAKNTDGTYTEKLTYDVLRISSSLFDSGDSIITSINGYIGESTTNIRSDISNLSTSDQVTSLDQKLGDLSTALTTISGIE